MRALFVIVILLSIGGGLNGSPRYTQLPLSKADTIMKAYYQTRHSHQPSTIKYVMRMTPNKNQINSIQFTLHSTRSPLPKKKVIFNDSNRLGLQMLIYNIPSQLSPTASCWIKLPHQHNGYIAYGNALNLPLLGSNISIHDFFGRELHEDTHTLKGETIRHFIVKSTPKSTDSPYGYILSKINKKTMLADSISYFDKQSQLVKAMEIRKIEKVGNHHIIKELIMVSHDTHQKTSIERLSLNLDPQFSKEFFDTK